MDKIPFEIVGFDLDGTLLDTSPDLVAAVNHALAAAGRDPLSFEQVKPNIGGGAKNMLRKTLEDTGGCDEAAFDRYYKLLLRHYEANIAVGTRPYSGLLDALDQLDAMGIRVAVVTNKFENLAVRLLGKLDLAGRFETIIGGDTMGKGNAKPSAAPINEMVARCGGGRAAFVGDSIYDTGAARNAGVPSIAVSFGFHSGPIVDLGADAVIDHYDELIPTLARLGDR
ncbi:HAD-IA family hydrolase [Stakelama tenebrarum]|uniref:Phosphoglycolate phosphatase n=1 Tax=Stakelama tenebrarum TaxID=2711215 RepID=A0A6G6Y3R6_9SPHN|nr:HAD-IA family hydrolase [Sphingosinithalassobacter tenebrarum]QIG79491.1 HAD-IA family hydrolase [Sphingosinithalassobacter tenebrarum]